MWEGMTRAAEEEGESERKRKRTWMPVPGWGVPDEIVIKSLCFPLFRDPLVSPSWQAAPVPPLLASGTSIPSDERQNGSN